ncbi:MAG: fibronectin type III domain-containing protein [Bacteroidales bacterium]|nr:fibronectin type III domain-containing protein [Bacteroidales bacterium]
MMALLCVPWVASAQLTIPYTTGFEGLTTGQLPTGWSQLQSGSSGSGTFPAVYQYASNARNGSVYFEFESSTGQTELAALPQVSDVSQLQLSFYASVMNHNFVFEVGVMDGTTFEPVDTIALTVGSGGNWHGSYNQYTVLFNNYTGSGDRMAMRVTSSGSYTLMIDDLEIDYIPSCIAPTNLTADSAGVDWLALSWQENDNATAWVVEYDINPIPDSLLGMNTANTVNVYGTPSTTLMGLDTSTTYHIYVYADCGSENSRAVSITASTLVGLPANVPYFCDFEQSGTNGWNLINGTQTNQWVVDSATNNGGSRSLYVSNNNGTSNEYSNNSTSHVFAERAITFSMAGEYTYSYDWKANGESSYDFIRAAIVPLTTELTAGDYSGFNNSSAVPAGGIAIDGAYRLNGQSSWQTQSGVFNITTPGTYKIVFLWRNDGSQGNNPPAAIDNVAISRNTCPAPYGLVASDVQPTEVTLTWHAGGMETAWEITYGEMSESAFDTTHTIYGLTPDTTYHFVLRAVCDVDDTSLPVSITVTTPPTCTTPTGRSIAGTGSSWVTLIWNGVANATSYQIAYGASGFTPDDNTAIDVYDTTYTITDLSNDTLYSVYVRSDCGGDDYSAWVSFGSVMPGAYIMTQSIDTLRVCGVTIFDNGGPTGNYSNYADNTLVLISPSTDSTIVLSGTLNSESSYDFLYIYDGIGTSGEQLYYGSGQGIAIGPFTSNTGAFTIRFTSDVSSVYSGYELHTNCVYLSGCPVPVNRSVVAQGSDWVTLNWSEANGATSYEIAYGPTGFTPDENTIGITVYDTSYTLTGLSSDTMYTIYIRSNCSESSTWVSFGDVMPGTYIMNQTVDTVRTCGINIYDNGGPDGNYASNSNNTLVLLSPSTDSTITLSGTYIGEGCCDYFSVYDGIGTSGTPLFSGTSPSSGSAVTIGPFISTTGAFTIHFTSDGSVQHAGFALHSNCVYLSDCTAPFNFTADSVLGDTVWVSWSDTANNYSFELAYGPSGINPDTVVDNLILVSGDSSYMFTGLTMGLAYDFYVRTDCGDEPSMWIGPVTATPGYFYNMATTGSYTIMGCGYTIYDNGGATGDYASNCNSTLVVYPTEGTYLKMYGSVNAETCCDHLYIYDGAGTSGTELYNGNSGTIDTLESTSGPLTIKFTSDGSVVSSGFEIHVMCLPVPDCGAVENLAVAAGVTSAMVTWNPSAYNPDNYTGAQVEYKLATDSMWTTITSSNTYAAITGLTPLSTYDLRVAAVCADGNSSWVTSYFNTRDYDCLVIDSTSSHNDTVSSATTGLSSTTSYNIPVNNYYHNTFSEQLYLASELDTAGASVITGLSLDYAYSSPMTYKTNCTVYLANTNRTSISTSDYVNPNDMVKVYEGSLNCSAGWNRFDFNEGAFSYTGGNLVVAVIDNSDNYNGMSYVWNCHSTSGKAFSWYSDSYFYPSSDMSTDTHSFRPNMAFHFIECSQTRTCAAPVAATANVATTSVDLVWAPGNTETSWNVYYRQAGTPNYTFVTTTTNTLYHFTNLASGTTYEFKVVGNCGTDSNACEVSATTLCAAIATLPFSENFNNWGVGTGVIPSCWYRTGSYSTYTYISANYNHSGTTGGSIYMYKSSSEDYTSWLIMPAIDTTVIAVNQTQLVFNALHYSSSYAAPAFVVGVMTDPFNTASFVPVDTVQHNGLLNQWNTFEVPFSNYTDNGAYIAIKTYYATNYFYTYVDDITLEFIPTCPRPDSLLATNATATTVDLSWHERGSATSWIIEYGPRGFQLGTGTIVTATSNPFTLTSLPSSYNGEFYVRSVCSAYDTGLYSYQPCPLSTSQLPASIPYSYNFEDSTEWANWQTNSNTTVNWFRGNAVPAYDGNYSMYVSPDNGATFGTNMTAVVNTAVWRDIDFGTIDTTFDITFRYKCGATVSNRYDGLMVFLVDPSVPVVASNSNITSPWGNVNDLYRIVNVRLDTTWTLAHSVLDTIHGVKRVAFFWFNQNTGNSYDWVFGPAIVDDIHIDYSSCPRPVNMAVNEASIGSTSATLTWNGSASAQYRVAYRVQGEPASTNQFVNTNTNSITLTGLSPLTTYVAWVQKLCGSDSSLFSDGVVFSTAMCENAVEITNATVCTESTSYFPGYATYEYSYTEVIMDSADLDGLTDITAWAFKPQNTTGGTYFTNCTIYLAHTSLTDLSGDFIQDTATFVKVFTGDLSYTTNDWQYIMFDTVFTWDGHSNIVVAIDRRHGGWTSSGYFDAFNASSSKARYIYRDGTPYTIGSISGGTATSTVPIYRLISCGSSACRQPSIASVTNDYHSATVTWVGTGTNYEVNIKPSAAPNWPANDITVTGNTYTFTGLQPATNYTFRVRQDCNADSLGYSEWVLGGFLTDSLPCLTPDSLHAIAATNATATFDWNVNGTETAWDIHVWFAGFDSVYRVTTRPATVGGFIAGVTYNASVRALCGVDLLEGDWSDTVTFSTAVCPNVTGLTAGNITANSITLNWTADPMAQGWVIEYGYYGFDQGTGTQVNTATNSYVFNGLEDETDYDFYVKAVCGTNWLSENWVNVSATTLSGGVTCLAPTGVTTTVADNSVTVNWTPGEGNISYELEYGPHGFSHNAGTVVSATTSPAVINNLDYETQYDVYVRALCDQNTYSAWSIVATFTTGEQPSEDCDPVTSLNVTEITETSATVTWTPGATGDRWQVVVSDPNGSTVSDATVSEPRANLTGLTRRTNYTVSVRTDCGDGNYSAYVTANFRTQGEGIDDVTSATCTIYPNPTSNSTTITVSGVNGKVKIAVVDMNGRTVATETLECNSDCAKTMDVDNLAQGAYFVRITGDSVNMVKKLIVR